MNLYKNQALLNYFLLKLTYSILASWAILISIISILDLSDLYNKTRLIEAISFNDIFLLTIENFPIRADDLLFYAILQMLLIPRYDHILLSLYSTLFESPALCIQPEGVFSLNLRTILRLQKNKR